LAGREREGNTKRGLHKKAFYMWAYGLKIVGFSHLSKWAEAHFSSKVGIELVARLLKWTA